MTIRVPRSVILALLLLPGMLALPAPLAAAPALSPPPPNHVTIDGSSSGLSRGFEATATLSPGGLLLQAARRVTVTIDYDDDKPSIIIPGSVSYTNLTPPTSDLV